MEYLTHLLPSPTFSCTERMIVNPVLYLRAPLLHDPDSLPGLSARIRHSLEAEGLSRITACFTSLFAAVDTCMHLAAGVVKGGYLLARKCCKRVPRSPFSAAEVRAHFREAAYFACITMVGSIAATVWPDLFLSFHRPPPPGAFDGGLDVLPEYSYLLSGVPQEEIADHWKKASLSDKRMFVNYVNSRADDHITRRKLAPVVYQPIVHPSKEPVTWLTGDETREKLTTSLCRPSHAMQYQLTAGNNPSAAEGFLCHTTSQEALLKILKAKMLRVEHQKLYRGAFVSTRPHPIFGNCTLVFKRNIERLSSLTHGFPVNSPEGPAYWAGFSKAVPVTEQTLAYVILNGSEPEREALERTCLSLTGRTIKVIRFEPAIEILEDIDTLDMGIPEEWPHEDAGVANAICTARIQAAQLKQKQQGQKAPNQEEANRRQQFMLVN